jgi:hypothetical protein
MYYGKEEPLATNLVLVQGRTLSSNVYTKQAIWVPIPFQIVACSLLGTKISLDWSSHGV